MLGEGTTVTIVIPISQDQPIEADAVARITSGADIEETAADPDLPSLDDEVDAALIAHYEADDHPADADRARVEQLLADALDDDADEMGFEADDEFVDGSAPRVSAGKQS